MTAIASERPIDVTRADESVAPQRKFNWGQPPRHARRDARHHRPHRGASLPFYWMVVLAFRETAYTFDTTWYPSHLTLDNFRYAFNTTNNTFARSLFNSLVIGIAVTAIAMIVGVFAGYAMARLSFRGKGFILAAILGASMFPGVAILTPIFQLFTTAGWLGTYQALILPQISFALPLAVYTLSSFFADMPWELEQAARVDGCNPGAGVPAHPVPIGGAGHLHDRDPGVPGVVERVSALQRAVQRQPQRRTVDGGHRQLHRRSARRSVYADDGRRCRRLRATGHRGPAVPAPDRQRP